MELGWRGKEERVLDAYKSAFNACQRSYDFPTFCAQKKLLGISISFVSRLRDLLFTDTTVSSLLVS